MWEVTFRASTERDRVGTLTATWTEATGEQFVFTDDQVNTNVTAQKNNFVSRAKSRQAAWKTQLDKDKASLAAIKTELETLLNA